MTATPGTYGWDDTDRAELDRLRSIESAAIALLGKVATHEARGYNHIRLGAFIKLRAALADSPLRPVDLDEATR